MRDDDSVDEGGYVKDTHYNNMLFIMTSHC